jgi:hypothetical protein
MGPGEARASDRARTYPGIADAMAQQWTAFYFPQQALAL